MPDRTLDGELSSDSDLDPPPTIDTRAVKAALARIAVDDNRAVIERAEKAVDDLDAAAVFADHVGLGCLAAAVSATDDPVLRERGATALATFQRFRVVASGDDPKPSIHFHSGHGTDLRDGGEGFEQ